MYVEILLLRLDQDLNVDSMILSSKDKQTRTVSELTE